MRIVATRRVAAVLAIAGLWAGTVMVWSASAWDSSPLNPIVVSQHHLCGSDDLPEANDLAPGGLQGDVPKADQDSGRAQQGYNCGLALVGYTPLDFDGRPNVNANMAWAGTCAYVSGSGGAPIVPETKPNPPAGAG